jgi:hypothetical protein
MPSSRFSRRNLVRAMGALAGGSLLCQTVGCKPPAMSRPKEANATYFLILALKIAARERMFRKFSANRWTFFGSAREFVKRPIWRGLERLCPTEGRRLARQSLLSEPQIQRWRPVLWGRTFHASSRSRKEPSHPIDSSWVGAPARLIA